MWLKCISWSKTQRCSYWVCSVCSRYKLEGVWASRTEVDCDLLSGTQRYNNKITSLPQRVTLQQFPQHTHTLSGIWLAGGKSCIINKEILTQDTWRISTKKIIPPWITNLLHLSWFKCWIYVLIWATQTWWIHSGECPRHPPARNNDVPVAAGHVQTLSRTHTLNLPECVTDRPRRCDSSKTTRVKGHI